MFAFVTALLTLTTSSLMALNLLETSRTNTRDTSKEATSNLINSEFDSAYNAAKSVPGTEVSVTEPYTYQKGFRTKTGYLTKEDEI